MGDFKSQRSVAVAQSRKNTTVQKGAASTPASFCGIGISVAIAQAVAVSSSGDGRQTVTTCHMTRPR